MFVVSGTSHYTILCVCVRVDSSLGHVQGCVVAQYWLRSEPATSVIGLSHDVAASGIIAAWTSPWQKHRGLDCDRKSIRWYWIVPRLRKLGRDTKKTFEYVCTFHRHGPCAPCALRMIVRCINNLLHLFEVHRILSMRDGTVGLTIPSWQITGHNFAIWRGKNIMQHMRYRQISSWKFLDISACTCRCFQKRFVLHHSCECVREWLFTQVACNRIHTETSDRHGLKCDEITIMNDAKTEYSNVQEHTIEPMESIHKQTNTC